MPFRELGPKQKARVTFRIQGPRTKQEQKRFKSELVKLLKKNRSRLSSR